MNSRTKNGKRQFKIRWKGFGPADDTWEDEENVDSPDLIKAYLNESSKDGNKGSPKKGKKRAGLQSPKEAPKKKPKTESDDENAEWEVRHRHMYSLFGFLCVVQTSLFRINT